MKKIFTSSLALAVLTLSLTSCNPKKSEGYTGIARSSFATTDIPTPEQVEYCSKATDLSSCLDLGSSCQGLFNDSAESGTEESFLSCIPKLPSVEDPTSELPASEQPASEEPASEIPVSEEPASEEPVPQPPVVEDPELPIPRNCDNLDSKFKVPGNDKKVIICHHTSSDSNPFHSIEISCNALKTHVDHHGDYLGACKEKAQPNLN
ncbi:MAG TPA: hypothetical protein VNJ01_03440 [Bacteriovoracaceae bacterium]|nr:hypothetical protein [Bacteriovoracaceae bacterium]